MASSAPTPKASISTKDDVKTKELRFSFNPSEYTVAKTATWNRPTTKGAIMEGKTTMSRRGTSGKLMIRG